MRARGRNAENRDERLPGLLAAASCSCPRRRRPRRSERLVHPRPRSRSLRALARSGLGARSCGRMCLRARRHRARPTRGGHRRGRPGADDPDVRLRDHPCDRPGGRRARIRRRRRDRADRSLALRRFASRSVRCGYTDSLHGPCPPLRA